MLKTNEDYRYVVVPGYLPYIENCRLERLADIPEWDIFPGRNVGGVLRVSAHMPNRQYATFLDSEFPELESGGSPGTTIGNEPARKIARRIHVLDPESIPNLAVLVGLAKRIRVPDVRVTLEHSDALDARCVIFTGKSLKKASRASEAIHVFSELLSQFDISVGSIRSLDSSAVEQLETELGNIRHRACWSMSIVGGLVEAEWQLSVLRYVSQIVDYEFKIFHGIHLCDRIQGEPNFRKFWTSNT